VPQITVLVALVQPMAASATLCLQVVMAHLETDLVMVTPVQAPVAPDQLELVKTHLISPLVVPQQNLVVQVAMV
jgi:hypothetical protein